MICTFQDITMHSYCVNFTVSDPPGDDIFTRCRFEGEPFEFIEPLELAGVDNTAAPIPQTEKTGATRTQNGMSDNQH